MFITFILLCRLKLNILLRSKEQHLFPVSIFFSLCNSHTLSGHLTYTNILAEVTLNQTSGDKVEQYSHFVKFRDQSYWHCNWIPGTAILNMHPSIVKNFHRRNADLVDFADEEYRAELRGEESCGVAPPKIPSSDDDDAEDSSSEVTDAPIYGGSFIPQ